MNSELRFDGQVALVTGAGGGLGRAHALLLAARGANVVVNDLGTTMEGERVGTSRAQSVADEITEAGGSAIASEDDVVRESGEIVAAALDAWGRVDIVVTSAGIGPVGSVAETPIDDWQRTVEVNLFGTLGVIRAAWPALAETAGRVVTVSSSAMFGQGLTAAYGASKAGVFALTRAVAEEGREQGIRANSIMPIAHTRMADGIAEMDPEFGKVLADHFLPERASAFVALLAHESVQVSGEVFSVGAGRAARVFLGVGRGWGAGDVTPEDFRDHMDEVMDLDGHTVPRTSGEEVIWSGTQLGLQLENMVYLTEGEAAAESS